MLLPKDQITQLLATSIQGWRVLGILQKGMIGILRDEVVPQQDPDRLWKQFKFKNFTDALAFVNKVGNLAGHHKHHPDMHLGWGYVDVYIYNHKEGGITPIDFVLAAAIDELSQ